MSDQVLATAVEDLRKLARRHGWSIERERAIPSGHQLWISDGADTVPVSLYSTGRALIQGKASDLQRAVQTWWQSRTPQQPAAAPSLPAASGAARIGMDEAGKGDYFGPLVVAAVYVDAQREARLRALGVRDSKLLSDERMSLMARRIRAECPHGVVILAPERYNQLYSEYRNLDRLLAAAHARALAHVLQQTTCTRAVADQFAREAVLEAALRERGISIDLEQRPRAESDLAVAAASILARTGFVRWMDQTSQRLGLVLPKGASDPAIGKIGRRLAFSGGRELLSRVAKLHFKTTASILEP